jgi:integrase
MPRRGRGEGSIFQRRDTGKFCGVLHVGWEGARRRRKIFYGDTAAEVQEKLLKARSDQSRGLPVATKRQSLAQFLDDWLENTVRRHSRPRTYEAFEVIVRLHLKPELGRLRLEQLTPQMVETLLNRKLEIGLAPQTVVHIRKVLKMALKKAVTWDLVARNAAALAAAPPMTRSNIHPLDDEQARRFVAAARGARLEALFVLAINTGLRRGELLGVRWSDVDLDRGTLRVAQQLQRIRHRLVFLEPKSKKSHRTLTLPASVVSALRAHRARQLEERLRAGKDWQDSGLVFTSHCGTPFDPRNLTRDFLPILKTAELPRIRFHDLRHTAATLLLMKGVQPLTVSEMLGHSSIVISLTLYGHVLPSMKREAADVMQSLLGG